MGDGTQNRVNGPCGAPGSGGKQDRMISGSSVNIMKENMSRGKCDLCKKIILRG
jgi:hypothetical protein